MQTILIVDDESQIRSALEGVLADEGYKTLLAESGEECLEMLRHKSPDVVLLDIWLPGIDGLETLEKLVEREDHPEVIMISGHGNIETAVRATKLGAFDFLEKPLSIERTLIVLKNAIEAKRLRSENLEFKKQFQARSVIVGDSIPMKALAPADFADGADQRPRADLRRIGHRQGIGGARDPCPEPAQGCHVRRGELRRDSGRPDRERTVRPSQAARFLRATADKEGKFQKADGGTLFLDEVGDMSLKTQSKVLRTLDEGRFAPVGEEEPITVDARVIAATNKDLEDEISKGNFREDLFYRLNVIPVLRSAAARAQRRHSACWRGIS